MSVRATISRREPVIALKQFRFIGRDYKEGAPLDRRRCRMPHSKLLRLIRTGFCILAKNMKPEELLKYGFIYNEKAPRAKLTRPSRVEMNQLLIDASFHEDGEEPVLKHVGGGWWNVLVNDKSINKNVLRKEAAIKLINDQKEE